MNGWVVLLWSFVAALVLIIVGIFGALAVMGRIDLFPEPTSSAAPTPEQTGVIDPTYSVLILNATPDSGLDDQMRDTLINAGWAAATVLASDSASDDFETTTVYYVSAEDEEAAKGLAGVIGGAEVQQSDYYAGQTEDGQKQLTIVIGVDRAASVPETPAP